MQAKIFKREKERLYLDDKGIATSKNLIKKMGVNIPAVRPDDNQTDLNLIKEDFDKVDIFIVMEYSGSVDTICSCLSMFVLEVHIAILQII